MFNASYFDMRTAPQTSLESNNSLSNPVHILSLLQYVPSSSKFAPSRISLSETVLYLSRPTIATKRGDSLWERKEEELAL